MDRQRQRELSQNIRREIGSPMTARFARSLPFFRTSAALPRELSELLDRLDDAERAQAGQYACYCKA